MTNTLAPFGFREAKHTGGAPNFQHNRRQIASNYGTPIFRGDPVVSLSSGYIGQAAPGTTQIAGIFMGCSYQSVAQKKIVWSDYFPANSDVLAGTVFAQVIDDPAAVFLVQGNGNIPFSAVGNNANFAIGTGDTATQLSGATLDVATIATTATLPFRIVDLFSSPPGANGADTASPYNWAFVTFNWQDLKSTTGI